ncbi:hypothetical protein [Citrobacter sp.]|uniref:hypothetical protein n=1 Tax=Citrobacter sp. TaxID=1896336 RepID=UPI002FC594B3
MAGLQVDSGYIKENETGIGNWGRGYGDAPPKSKNKKNPTVYDIDWRQLDSEECQRLWYLGTKSGKAQALKSIIAARREVMTKSNFQMWYHQLCNGWNK